MVKQRFLCNCQGIRLCLLIHQTGRGPKGSYFLNCLILFSTQSYEISEIFSRQLRKEPGIISLSPPIYNMSLDPNCSHLKCSRFDLVSLSSNILHHIVCYDSTAVFVQTCASMLLSSPETVPICFPRFRSAYWYYWHCVPLVGLHYYLICVEDVPMT